MNVLVIYDSVYGNTEKIARAIGTGIAGDVKVLSVKEADPSNLKTDLLIFGSPTQGGRPERAMQEFLDKIPSSSLKGMNVAAFDTRIPAKWVKIFGFAGGKIGDILKSKGGNLIAPPEGFFVKSTKGPPADGELERAAAWGKEIMKPKA